MPLYEYQCEKCKNISTHLMLKKDEFNPFCKKCGSKELKKILSRVTIKLSEETRLKKVADTDFLGSLECDDPKALRKSLSKMGAVIGDKFEGNFDNIIDEAIEAENKANQDNF